MRNILISFFLSVLVAVSSGQVPVPGNGDNVVKHKYYWINYNSSCNVARYTFYKSYKTRLEKNFLERGDWFKRDPLVEGGIPKITFVPYDRGHLVPFEDMSWDTIAGKETFYMSNMVPQISSLNKGVWSKLEKYARDLTMKYDSAYITTGAIFDTEARNTIKSVCIPSKVYKIIFYYTNKKWKSECYLIPNAKPVSTNLLSYKINISQLADVAGIIIK